MTNGIFSSSAPGTPAVSATGSNGADGIDARTDTGTAVNAVCSGSDHLTLRPFGIAISATGPTGINATCNTFFGIGVHAVGAGANPVENPPVPRAAIFAEGGPGPGLYATSDGSSAAVNGAGTNGAAGVSGSSDSGIGVHAVGGGANFTTPPVTEAAIFAEGGPGPGVFATSDTGPGVFAESRSGVGVHAVGGGAAASATGGLEAAILADGGPGIGVWATSTGTSTESIAGIFSCSGGGAGVSATSISGPGVFAESQSGIGVHAVGGGATGVATGGLEAAIFAEGGPGIGVLASGAVALQVIGKIEIQGNSAGMVAMAAGATTMTVTNPAATANSLIVLTPLDNPQAFLWVAARNAGSFTIDASGALLTPVNIMFLIIN
jgi:hypothetical protein